jgi:hypothetical protein
MMAAMLKVMAMYASVENIWSRAGPNGDRASQPQFDLTA